MDLLGGPDALPALGTDELSGGAGPLAAWGGSSRLGGPSGPGPNHRGQGAPPNLDFIPPLFQGVFHQIVPWRSVPPVLPVGDTGQTVGLCNFFEPFVMVSAISAHLTNFMYSAKNVAHFVQKCIGNFLDWVIKNFGGDVQFISTAVWPLPDLRHGTVPVGPWFALNRDNGDRQLPVEKVCVEAIVYVL